MAASASKKSAGFLPTLKRWAFSKSGFNQYGLRAHDMLNETTEVKEAIRRLPPRVYDDRAFRITRALHLSMLKRVLPKEEWTKYEDDNWYMQPYLDEVEKESRVKKEWSNK